MFFVFVQLVYAVDAKRILMLPHLQASHANEHRVIGSELVRRGHEVYVVLAESSKKVSFEGTGITVLRFKAGDAKLIDSAEFEAEVSEAAFAGEKMLAELFIGVASKHCSLLLDDARLMDELHALNFDYAVVDSFLLDLCLLIVPRILQIPYSSISCSLVPLIIGIPWLPTLGPPLFLPFPQKLNFWQKAQTFFISLSIATGTGLCSCFSPNSTLLKMYAPEVDSWYALMRKSDLFVIPNSFVALYPMLTLPNVIRTNGIAMKPARGLSQDWLSAMQGEKGSVVVSFGSTGGAMPRETIQVFARTFQTLSRLTFVWRLPQTKGVPMPRNVHNATWLPQNDLIAHNDTKLFISHCGVNGYHEAIYHGVPLICIPLWGDQIHNAAVMEEKGFGRHLTPVTSITQAQLTQTIKEVLRNDVIRRNVKKMSRVLKDSKPPRETIADWLEHVMEHGGKHLRSITQDMPVWEMLMLDMVCIVMAIVCCLSVLATCVGMTIWRSFSAETPKAKKE